MQAQRLHFARLVRHLLAQRRQGLVLAPRRIALRRHPVQRLAHRLQFAARLLGPPARIRFLGREPRRQRFHLRGQFGHLRLQGLQRIPLPPQFLGRLRGLHLFGPRLALALGQLQAQRFHFARLVCHLLAQRQQGLAIPRSDVQPGHRPFQLAAQIGQLGLQRVRLCLLLRHLLPQRLQRVAVLPQRGQLGLQSGHLFLRGGPPIPGRLLPRRLFAPQRFQLGLGPLPLAPQRLQLVRRRPGLFAGLSLLPGQPLAQGGRLLILGLPGFGQADATLRPHRLQLLLQRRGAVLQFARRPLLVFQRFLPPRLHGGPRLLQVVDFGAFGGQRLLHPGQMLQQRLIALHHRHRLGHPAGHGLQVGHPLAQFVLGAAALPLQCLVGLALGLQRRLDAFQVAGHQRLPVLALPDLAGKPEERLHQRIARRGRRGMGSIRHDGVTNGLGC